MGRRALNLIEPYALHRPTFSAHLPFLYGVATTRTTEFPRFGFRRTSASRLTGDGNYLHGHALRHGPPCADALHQRMDVKPVLWVMSNDHSDSSHRESRPSAGSSDEQPVGGGECMSGICRTFTCCAWLILACGCSCRGVGDPSCAVRAELRHQPCFSSRSTGRLCDPLNDAAWYHDPSRWTPQCSNALASQRSRQGIPTAAEVLALPDRRSPAAPPADGGSDATGDEPATTGQTSRDHLDATLERSLGASVARGSLIGVRMALQKPRGDGN